MRPLIVVLLSAMPVMAATGDTIPMEARQARHLIVPFIGYQIQEDEMIGAGFELSQSSPLFPDTTFHWSGHYSATNESRTPALGLSYRYRILDPLFIEATFGVIQDQKKFTYKAVLPVYDFAARYTIEVDRGNTTFLSAGGAYQLPTGLGWLGAGIKAHIGYAWRTVKTSKGGTTNQGGTVTTANFYADDAESMLSVGGGLEGTLWRGDLLLVRAGINYTQFLPQNGPGDPFGGIGWQVGLFPIWGGR
ncbi:MAG: hypothetical protein FJY67_04950 [Calditrichaeota bacterium]|nr:hypothetical protein [Calditrichota bacterium]